MNMNVSNEELHELLTKFMKRLDKMEKERDVMKKKLDRLSKHVSDVNNAIDEVYDIMHEGEFGTIFRLSMLIGNFVFYEWTRELFLETTNIKYSICSLYTHKNQ